MVKIYGEINVIFTKSILGHIINLLPISRDNMDIITVVLGADTKKDRTKDSVKLIEYAFANYKIVNIEEKISTEK